MNMTTRKDIDDLIAQLQSIKEQIGTIRYNEEEKYDNMPESLQESEKGEAMSNAIDNLESAMDSIEEVTSYLEEAKGE